MLEMTIGSVQFSHSCLPRLFTRAVLVGKFEKYWPPTQPLHIVSLYQTINRYLFHLNKNQ